MIDERVTALLEESVPDFEGAPANWSDVVRRVRRHRRRRVAVGVALVAGFAVLVLPPAGLGERLIDWFRGTPAPPEVREAIERPNDVPPPVFELLRERPEIEASKARGVLAIQTSRGPVRLWAAPQKDGGACAFIQVGVRDGRAVGSEACHPPIRQRTVRISADLRPIDARLQEDGLVFAIVFGWKRGIDVIVTWSDRSRSRVPVTDGYALTEVKAGAEAVEAYAVRGSAILSAQALPSPRPPAMPALDAPYRVVAEATTFDGRRVTLAITTAGGKPCERIEVADSGGGSGCGDVTEPVTVNADLSAGVLFGRVVVPAKTLRILFEDGDRATVPVTEGAFLYAVQPPHLKSGHLPAKIQALAGDGSILATVLVNR
jgi:hypothetical protein